MGESSITGPDLIRDTSEKVDLIRKRLPMAQSRQKSYADRRATPTEELRRQKSYADSVTPQKYPRIFIIILLYIPGIN